MKFPPASKNASKSLNDDSLFIAPMPNCSHLSPMLIAPSWRGDTRMPARGPKTRKRPRGVFGSGRGANTMFDVVKCMLLNDSLYHSGPMLYAIVSSHSTVSKCRVKLACQVWDRNVNEAFV